MDPELAIRPIVAGDDDAVAAIIRAVMPEFGAGGAGFAIHDPEVACMSRSYARAGAAYFVVSDGKRVLGGGGVAPLDGGAADTCELRKMYFQPELRGRGAGKALLEHCLATARTLGYRRCYLETLAHMTAARALYTQFGFAPLPAALGCTGHFGCDTFYTLDL